MDVIPPSAQVRRFGIFELDLVSGELRRHGAKIRLADQPFQILRLLLDRAGEVVARQELRQKLWSEDTFVDFDTGLNSAIRKLREALRDSAENPRFVETVPRRGYRFIAPVQPAPPEPLPDPETRIPTASGGPLRPARIAAGLVVIVLAIGTLVLGHERQWWEAPGARRSAEGIRSVAVLPFDNLTGDPAQDYFVNGVTEALTTNLAEIAGLQIISRASANQYKGAKKPMPVIGQELHVDALVAGAIVKSGRHVQITAQLIRAATDRHVWAKSYDVDASDVLPLQRDIARAIVSAIEGR